MNDDLMVQLKMLYKFLWRKVVQKPHFAQLLYDFVRKIDKALYLFVVRISHTLI